MTATTSTCLGLQPTIVQAWTELAALSSTTLPFFLFLITKDFLNLL